MEMENKFVLVYEILDTILLETFRWKELAAVIRVAREA